MLLPSHAAPLAQMQENLAVVQFDHVHADSACRSQDLLELIVVSARRLDAPAPPLCHAACHRASREGSITDKRRHN